MFDINPKEYVEALTFTTKKVQRHGFGKKIMVLVGKKQEYLSGMKIINFDLNGKYCGTITQSAAETIQLIVKNQYILQKCESIREAIR